MTSRSFRYVCIYLLIQCIAGKSIDLEYGYQEIEGESPSSQQGGSIPEERKHELKQIWEYFDVMVQSERDSYVVPDYSKKIAFVKRDVSENSVDLEGSGDSDDPRHPSTENKEVTQIIKEHETTKVKQTLMEQSSTSTGIIVANKELNQTKEIPVMFKGGFDNILMMKPAQKTNNSNVIESKLEENNILAAPKGEQSNEIIETAESKEGPTSSSPSTGFLLVLAGLGVIGTLALSFNYVKKRKEEKEAGEVMEVEKEGKELKEMKPLMKSPLSQNGARSLEYIDAEPQHDNEVDLTDVTTTVTHSVNNN